MASKAATAPKPKNQPAPTPKSQQVAKAGDESVPAHLKGYESQGAGVPTDQKDFLIPMAKVLDAKSPEVTKGNSARVNGAEPGDIFVKNAPQPLIKGEVGFLFQPCYRDSAVIEWVPRNKGGGGGTGFVARHPDDFITQSDDAVQKPHPENPEAKIWIRKSTGNQLVETRYYGGFWIDDEGENPPMPLVLPFSSTGHTVAKQWNMLLASKRIGGKSADIWLIYYRIKTRNVTRRDQSWYLFDPADAGEDRNGMPTTLWVPSLADAERGKKLYEDIASGAKKFDESSDTSGDAGGTTKIPF